MWQNSISRDKIRKEEKRKLIIVIYVKYHLHKHIRFFTVESASLLWSDSREASEVRDADRETGFPRRSLSKRSENLERPIRIIETAIKVRAPPAHRGGRSEFPPACLIKRN